MYIYLWTRKNSAFKFWNSKINKKQKEKEKMRRSEIIRCWQVLGTLAE